MSSTCCCKRAVGPADGRSLDDHDRRTREPGKDLSEKARQRQHIKFGTHDGFMALPMQDEPGVLRAESDQYCLSATFLRCGPVAGSHEESAHSHTMLAVQNCHLPAMSTFCSTTRGASVALGLPMKLPGVVRVSAVRHAHTKAKYTYTLLCLQQCGVKSCVTECRSSVGVPPQC